MAFEISTKKSLSKSIENDHFLVVQEKPRATVIKNGRPSQWPIVRFHDQLYLIYDQFIEPFISSNISISLIIYIYIHCFEKV